jgi:hypothetical protein
MVVSAHLAFSEADEPQTGNGSLIAGIIVRSLVLENRRMDGLIHLTRARPGVSAGPNGSKESSSKIEPLTK